VVVEIPAELGEEVELEKKKWGLKYLQNLEERQR
jgi:hypothetical protein